MQKSKIEWCDWHSKTAAKRIGISIEEYLNLKKRGLKHCTKCKTWKPIIDFCLDKSRGDGLSMKCNECRRKRPANFISKCKDKEYINKRQREWYARTGAAAIRSRVHARKRNIIPVDKEYGEYLLNYFDYRCAYCGIKSDNLTFDHIHPVKRGGETLKGNLVPACISCNSSKKTSLLSVWAKKKGITISDKVIDIISLAEVNGYAAHEY